MKKVIVMDSLADMLQSPLLAAILHNETVKLQYQGNDRHVIPLVFGMLKNGKEALLCYKLDEMPDGSFLQSIRLYHADKITDLEPTGRSLPHSRKIDYYLTRHYRRVYLQV
jgi:hypothetical protein